MDLRLIKTLESAGQQVVSLPLFDGAQALVLPHGGRILGLYASGSEENFLWTNPLLRSERGAVRLFASSGWRNTGGDRTWLAPEIDLFIGDLERPAMTYGVQPTLDPGNWTLVSATGAELSLSNSARVTLLRSQRTIGITLSKRVRPALNPLQGTPLATRGLEYAGYTQVTTLELEPVADAAIRLGLWSLLQLSQPGEMLIPTLFEARPHVVFGAVTADELAVTPRLVRWTMGGCGDNAKISLKAAALTGRAGHLRRTARAGVWELVVREFTVDPKADYVDALWEHPHEAGWTFQACCVRGSEERFNELEYHAPAVTAADGVNCGHDESRVWAFRGPAVAIDEAAHALLGTGPGIVQTELSAQERIRT